MSDDERRVSVFLVDNELSGVPLGYADDLAVDAHRSGRVIHQGLMIEGNYLPDVSFAKLEEELAKLAANYPNTIIEYYADFGVIAIYPLKRE